MPSIIYSIAGSIAVCATVIGMIPQVFKSLKTKSMEDVSLVVLINYFITSVSWLIYGIGISDNLIIWSNALGVVTSSTLLTQKFIYKRRIS